MCPLYFCPLCKNHQPFTAFINLYKHIRSIHRNDTPFNIRCLLNPTCGSVYTTFQSYRSHLNRYHRDLLNDYGVPADALHENEELSSLLSSNTNLIQDEEDEEIEDIILEENSNEDEPELFEDTRSNENDIDWPLFANLINAKNDSEEFTFKIFEKYYTHFLLDLRESHLLPQSIIKSITSYFTTMLDALFKIIQHQATQSSAGLVISLVNIEKLMLQIKTLVSNITKNDYQFTKRCEEHFGYVASS